MGWKKQTKRYGLVHQCLFCPQTMYRTCSSPWIDYPLIAYYQPLFYHSDHKASHFPFLKAPPYTSLPWQTLVDPILLVNGSPPRHSYVIVVICHCVLLVIFVSFAERLFIFRCSCSFILVLLLFCFLFYLVWCVLCFCCCPPSYPARFAFNLFSSLRWRYIVLDIYMCNTHRPLTRLHFP